MRAGMPGKTAMRCLVLVLVLVLALAALPAAADPLTPERGSDLRADLLDAIRPHAEWDLGAPVEFVVGDLRVSGDVAFADLWAQRPGGAQIAIESSPMAQRGEWTGAGDGPQVQALLQRSGRMWVAVHVVVSPSEAWWMWEPLCPLWAPVMPPEATVCGD